LVLKIHCAQDFQNNMSIIAGGDSNYEFSDLHNPSAMTFQNFMARH